MNSGDLSYKKELKSELTGKEKINLQERTAFFINLAGITIQEVLSAVDTGISSRKLYKVLANITIDWHWLSSKDINKFKFNGVGELVWTPMRYGALGLVKPNIKYEKISFYYGLFPITIELFNSRAYRKYGFRGVSPSRYMLFPLYIDYEKSLKSRVEPQEQHYWKILTKIYASLDGETLNALASCRTTTTCIHSLWIEFVLWKRYMGFAMDSLCSENPLNEEAKKKIKDNIETARACKKNILTKIEYHKDINKYINRAKQAAASTELSSYIPCVDELTDDSLQHKYNTFITFTEIFVELHKICRRFQRHIGLDSPDQKDDLNSLENTLKYLENNLNLSQDIINSQDWFPLFQSPNSRKEIAQRILILIETLFTEFEQKSQLKFERPTKHYNNFLDNYYPLPRDHFIRGN